LSTGYKDALSAIIQKIKCSWAHVEVDIFLVLYVYVELFSKFVYTFQLHAVSFLYPIAPVKCTECISTIPSVSLFHT
jgi:hypothetical protein